MPTTLSPPEPPLTDGVVSLRAFRDEDAEALAAMMEEPEIAQWTRAPSPYALSDALEWLAMHPALLRRGELPLAVVHSRTDELLGSMGLRLRDEGRGEFGYLLGAHARGRGLATRALTLYCRHAFDELGVERLEILIRPGNSRSQALAERVGFRAEGLLRSHSVMHGERVDMVLLALLPGELGERP